MQYTYEFELYRGEKQWIVDAFGIDAITQGVDIKDACESAADILRVTILEYLMHGTEIPTAIFTNQMLHNGTPLIVSVDASLDDIERVSATEAANVLGVTRSRITAMMKSGFLDGWRDGRNTWVTKNSLNERLKDKPKAGRPKKQAAA